MGRSWWSILSVVLLSWASAVGAQEIVGPAEIDLGRLARYSIDWGGGDPGRAAWVVIPTDGIDSASVGGELIVSGYEAGRYTVLALLVVDGHPVPLTLTVSVLPRGGPPGPDDPPPPRPPSGELERAASDWIGSQVAALEALADRVESGEVTNTSQARGVVKSVRADFAEVLGREQERALAPYFDERNEIIDPNGYANVLRRVARAIREGL